MVVPDSVCARGWNPHQMRLSLYNLLLQVSDAIAGTMDTVPATSISKGWNLNKCYSYMRHCSRYCARQSLRSWSEEVGIEGTEDVIRIPVSDTPTIVPGKVILSRRRGMFGGLKKK